MAEKHCATLQAMQQQIAILTGGQSTERDIALASAASVERALKSHAEVTVFDMPRELDRFIACRKECTCAIPVFHGRGGEDGTIQGFLETLGMPYIFSGVAAHALAMNKKKTNVVVDAAGIKVPKNSIVHSTDGSQWTHNLVIKPTDGGSSVGVTIAHNQAELERGVAAALTVSSEVLIEEYVAGKEFSVAVIDVDGKTEALPVISIESKHEFFDYASKYETDLAVETCPADIANDLADRLKKTAVQVHQIIGARHVSRSDFIVDDAGAIWFLEVNTIPGMSVLLPKAIVASGRDFGTVLMGWVNESTAKS